MSKSTIKDVANKAGVSVATVSYVLNGKKSISEATKQKVYAAMEELNYVPNINAQGLNSNSSRLIGVVVPQTENGDKLMFQNGFYSEVLGSIEYHARQKGYHVIISATDTNESYLKLAKQRNLDGIIVIGMYPDEFYKELKKTDIPIVLIDSYCNDFYYHSIRIDDAYGSYLATRYLLKNGHRDIAFFVGQVKDNGVMKKRLQGYKNALEEFDVEFNGKYVFEGQIDYDSGIQMADDLVDSKLPVTSIVCAADILAIGVMSELYKRGVKVPDDISIVGFDDLEISKYLTPPLTTVHQHISLKGQKAVELLLEHIEKTDLPKQEEVLSLELVERGSVKTLV
jgi:LacI family transcriptional regulator